MQLPRQNVTFEASWPGLFVDKRGVYWDVPLSLSADLASVGSSSGLSYHLLLQQNSGEPKCFGGNETSDVPIALLPGFCAKAAVSIKKSIDAWRKKEDKLKNVQPYDVFLSDSHVSFTGIVGKYPLFIDVDPSILPAKASPELLQFIVLAPFNGIFLHPLAYWFCYCPSNCFGDLFIHTPCCDISIFGYPEYNLMII